MITAPTEFSGLQVWLDGSDTTSLFQLSGGTTAVAANLDPVGYWGDKSGNNRHFTNIGGSATTRPTWVSSLSTVRFDGSNDYLSSFFNITYTAQTVFVVVSQRLQSGNARIYTQVSSGGADTTQAGHYVPCLTTTTTSYGSYIGGVLRSTVTPRSLNAFEVFTSTQSSVSAINFLNGVAGSAFGNTINYAVALSRIGAAATTAGGFFNGDISEVIVYNRALTNLERADVEYYLTRKWNFLNSIPRQVYGIKDGLWSSTDTWSVSAEPSPWNFPLSADNAYTNTFTITADSSTKVDTIRNSSAVPNINAGGSFVLANGVSLSANVQASVSPYLGTILPGASAELIGNVVWQNAPSVGNVSVLVDSPNCNLIIKGNLAGRSASVGATRVLALSAGSSGSNVTIYGTVSGGGGTGGYFPGVEISNPTATCVIYGNVEGGIGPGGPNPGVSISSGYLKVIGNVNTDVQNAGQEGIRCIGGRTEINGNVYGFASTGINISTNTSSVLISGNIIASNWNRAIVSVSTTTTPLSVYGNIINAPNGRQAIYAPRYQVFPTGSAQYTRHAVNGYDSYVDYWTSNSTFSYPASSDVTLGTTYSNSTLSGSMAVPSPSSVALGALVGTTTGTASITLDNVLSQPISNLTTPNSIGARLKNITTSQALSAIVDSLEF